MFDMFDVFVPCILTSSYPYVPVHLLLYSHPRILIALCLCVLACILAPLHPHILRFMCPCLHPCILIFSGSCALACIPASSYPQVCVWLLLTLYHHILISLKKTKLYGPFLWMGFNCLKASATSRRQFTFYH